MWVADDFLTRGFEVSRPKRTHARSADLVVVGRGIDATIEVYSPRVWQALDDWTLELQDAVKNLDEPYDFEIEIAVRSMSQADPWTIARGLDLTAEPVIETAQRDLTTALELGKPFSAKYDHGDAGLETELELRHAQPSTEGPARFIVSGSPGLSQYAPKAMFDRLVNRTVLRRKAGRRQTQTAATRLRGMAVDLARTQIAHDLRHDYYRDRAKETLGGARISRVGLDFVAFCGPNDLCRGLAVDFVLYAAASLTADEVVELFPSAAALIPAPG